MELWQRRILGVLALGVGVAGLLKILSIMMATEGSVDLWITVVVAVLLFGGGVWCGLRLLEQRRGAVSENLTFWCLQIPIFKTPLVGYEFYTALRGVLGIKINADDWNLKFGIYGDAAGAFNWSVLRFDGEWQFAVNILAIVAVCLLSRALRRQSSDPLAEAA